MNIVRRRIFAAAIAALLPIVALSSPASAQTEKRVALVIGNGVYEACGGSVGVLYCNA